MYFNLSPPATSQVCRWLQYPNFRRGHRFRRHPFPPPVNGPPGPGTVASYPVSSNRFLLNIKSHPAFVIRVSIVQDPAIWSCLPGGLLEFFWKYDLEKNPFYHTPRHFIHFLSFCFSTSFMTFFFSQAAWFYLSFFIPQRLLQMDRVLLKSFLWV